MQDQNSDLASLEDLYADTPPAAKAQTPAPEPAPAEVPAEAEAEAEADAWKKVAEPADKQEKPPAAKPEKAKPGSASDEEEEEPSDVVGLKAALKATRQKARERGTKASDLERELNDVRERYSQLDTAARQLWAAQQQQVAQQQQPEPPDANLDPAGALAYERAQMAEALRGLDAQTRQGLYIARLVPSQRILREKYADYNEMEAMFKQAADADPRLWAAIKQHEFPAEFAYNTAKEIKQRQEIQAAGSFDKYVEQLVAQKMAAAQPATPTVPTSPAAPKAPPPQSLARVPSVTPRTSKAYSGPTPLADLYK